MLYLTAEKAYGAMQL